MDMIVQSLRLGEIEIPEEKLIYMERPVLGFEDYKQFCLIEIDEFKPFLWLQSTEKPAVAFLVVNPKIFVSDYKIEINSKEIAELDIENVNSVETYVVVTLSDKIENMTINLQGPILINTENQRGKQLVLVNSDYEVNYKFMTHTVEEETEVNREVPVEV
ncbi:MAG: flagellar assembly protein FliW [Calditrichaeota bacterium]|nr:MAG: flagellar assembly protein FliW [Calditrichota bacterium]